MTNFSFTNSHLPINSQFSFARQSACDGFVCEMLTDKLMINDKWKMENMTGGNV